MRYYKILMKIKVLGRLRVPVLQTKPERLAGAVPNQLGQKNNQKRYLYTGISLMHSGHLSDPENKGVHEKGINFDTLGSWNNRIEMSLNMEKSIEMGHLIPELPLDQIGTASLIGRRKENEDRFGIERISDDLMYFAIFDGHGGSVAVDFVHTNILNYIHYWLSKTSDLADVLRNTFQNVNQQLTEHLTAINDVKNRNTGTTATVCLLKNNIELVVGHVGDTRAVLCRNGCAVMLTKDHTPDDSREAKRIRNSGGYVIENSLGIAHVNGRLGMTRSLGDIELKPYGVIAEPQIESKEIQHDIDSFLLLTTDGLSFVLNDQELLDIVGNCSSPKEAATYITDQALQFGSHDNSTAVVIPFAAWGKFRAVKSIPYSFGRHLSSNRY